MWNSYRAILVSLLLILSLPIYSSMGLSGTPDNVHDRESVYEEYNKKNFTGEYVKFINYPPDEWEEQREYKVVRVSDEAVRIIRNVTDRKLDRKQVFEYSPEEPKTYHSGYPIHMGSAVYNDTESPPWFIMYHEVGHNYNTQWSYYNIVCADQQLTAFDEAFASLAALYTLQKFRENKSKYRERFGDKPYEDLMEANDDLRDRFSSGLQEYRQDGKKFNLDAENDNPSADAVDGMLIELGDKYGWDIYPQMYENFDYLNSNRELIQNLSASPSGNGTTKERLGVLLAALNQSTEEDLAPYYQSQNLAYDASTYEKVNQWLTERAGGEFTQPSGLNLEFDEVKSPSSVERGETATVLVYVENNAPESGKAKLTLSVANQSYTKDLRFAVWGRDKAHITINSSFLSSGTHQITLSIGNASKTETLTVLGETASRSLDSDDANAGRPDIGRQMNVLITAAGGIIAVVLAFKMIFSKL